MSPTLKVDADTYERLNRVAGNLREKSGRPCSLNRAIRSLLDAQQESSALAFAGAWEVSDEELQEIQQSLARMWSSWRIGS